MHDLSRNQGIGGAIEWAVSLVSAAPSGEHPVDASPKLALVLSEALDAVGASAAVTSVSDDRLEATFTMTGEDYRDVFVEGARAWADALAQAGLPGWPVIQAEIATYEAVEDQIDSSALPDLVGVAEVAQTLGVSKQRVSTLRKEGRLPRPLAHLASGPVWAAAGIEKFLTSWNRRVGRPEGTRTAQPHSDKPE